jgi:hypothetical protein
MYFCQLTTITVVLLLVLGYQLDAIERTLPNGGKLF